MKNKIRIRQVVAGALLALVAALGEATAGAQAPQGQSALPASAPQQTPTTPAQLRSLSLEERADIFMARKSYFEAADHYYRALKQSKFTSAPLWNKLGIAYQQQLNFRAARKAYDKAVHLKKDFPEPLNNTGTTYFMQNKFGKAVKYYRRALEMNVNSAAFHVNLGTSLFRLKKFNEGVDEYRTALGLDPNVLSEHSPTAAVVQARSADPEYFFYIAKVFASLGRIEDAVRNLRRAFEDGFKDQKRIEEDPDFQKISQHPAYVELMKNLPVPIKE